MRIILDPNAFALLMLGVIAMSLGCSGYYFQMAIEQVRPILSAAPQDEFAARFALDCFVWSGKAAAPARRSYLRSHAPACIAFFGMTALAAGNDSTGVTVGTFAAISLVAIVVTLLAGTARAASNKGRPPRGIVGGRHGFRPVPRKRGQAEDPHYCRSGKRPAGSVHSA